MRERASRQAAGPEPHPNPRTTVADGRPPEADSGWGCGGARALHRLMGGALLQAATGHPASSPRRRRSPQAECESDRLGRIPPKRFAAFAGLGLRWLQRNLFIARRTRDPDRKDRPLRGRPMRLQSGNRVVGAATVRKRLPLLTDPPLSASGPPRKMKTRGFSIERLPLRRAASEAAGLGSTPHPRRTVSNGPSPTLVDGLKVPELSLAKVTAPPNSLLQRRPNAPLLLQTSRIETRSYCCRI